MGTPSGPTALPLRQAQRQSESCDTSRQPLQASGNSLRRWDGPASHSPPASASSCSCSSAVVTRCAPAPKSATNTAARASIAASSDWATLPSGSKMTGSARGPLLVPRLERRFASAQSGANWPRTAACPTTRASSSAQTAKSARAARAATPDAADIRRRCRAMLIDQLSCNQASWRGVVGAAPTSCPTP